MHALLYKHNTTPKHRSKTTMCFNNRVREFHIVFFFLLLNNMEQYESLKHSIYYTCKKITFTAATRVYVNSQLIYIFYFIQYP